MKGDDLLMVADSMHNADMLYAVRMIAPDPFIYLRLNGRCHIVLDDCEMGRAKKEARHCRIISLSQCQERLRKSGVKKFSNPAQVVKLLLKDKGVKRVTVPEQFPIGLARELKRLKVKLKISKNGAFPQRTRKNPEEIKKINAAMTMAEVGLAEGIQALKGSKISKNRKLLYRGSPMTAERLRAIMDSAILQAGGLASHTAVAGGLRSCHPHDRGYGSLRAHEPIVIKVQPKSQRTGYFGVITRTVVRGRASEAIRQVYGTVRKAQDVAIDQLRRWRDARTVHQSVQEFFDQAGYRTLRQNHELSGFIHDTGHGVGLDFYEAPLINLHSNDTLENGMVVTIEPGLYYPELGGGVRLEDVVQVCGRVPKNLTKFEKVLEV